MESKFVITLLNTQTEEFHSEEQEFVTFEEAAMHANRMRHKKGHQWCTTSIIRVMKGLNPNVGRT